MNDQIVPNKALRDALMEHVAGEGETDGSK